MTAPVFRADPGAARIAVDLDHFTAVFHRPSGSTHLLVDPAPQILGVLADAAMTAAALLAVLQTRFELVDADPAALAERLDELVAAGLVYAA